MSRDAVTHLLTNVRMRTRVTDFGELAVDLDKAEDLDTFANVLDPGQFS